MIEFLSYQGITALFLLLIALSGWFVSGFIREKQKTKEEQLLFHLLIGMLFLITGFALFMSQGITILAGLLIPLFFLRKRLSFLPDFSSNKINILYFKWIGLVFILSCIYSFIEFLWIYNWEVGAIIEAPHLDFVYYAKYSYSLAHTGAENRLLSLNNSYPEFHKVRIPYHYPELWLNALLIKLTEKSALKCLLLVSYPLQKAILTFLICVGIRSSSSRFSFGKSLFSAIVFLTITGFYFSFYKKVELLQYFDGITQTGSLMNLGKKYLLISIYVSYFFLYHFRTERYKPFFIGLSIIPLFSIGTAPGVVSLLLLMPLYLYFIRRLNANEMRIIYLNTGLTCLFIAGFYTFFGGSDLNDSMANSVLALKFLQSPDISKLKLVIFGSVFPMLRFIFYYSPYLLLIGIFIQTQVRRTLNDLLILIILLVFSGCISASLAIGIHDNGQFFYNLLPIINSAIIVALISIVTSNQHNQWHKTILAALLIFGVYHLKIDSNKTLREKEETNQIHPGKRLATINLLQQTNFGKPLLGMFRENVDRKHEYSYLFSTLLNRHTYLSYLDTFEDAINIDLEPHLKRKNGLNSVDHYLILQNEFAVFMRKEGLDYSPESLEQFSKHIHASFLTYGDSLLILKNSEIPENLPFYLAPSLGD